jgi:hypothetical protein
MTKKRNLAEPPDLRVNSPEGATDALRGKCDTTRLTKWQRTFLRVLRQTPDVKAACAAARVARSTAYRRRDADDVFRQQWDDALAASVDELEAVAFVRARDGDSNLLQFLLRAHRPETYNPVDRHEVGLLGGIIYLPQKEDKEP